MRTAKRGFGIALLAALGCAALGWAPALAAAPAVPPRVTAQATPAPSPATKVAAAPQKPAEPTYTARGAQSCMKCHDQAPVTDILKSPHAVKGDSQSPFGQHECESCHGPSDKHASSTPGYGEKRALPEVSFAGPNASPVEQRNAVCLDCHEGGIRMNWSASAHAESDVACTSCHTLHATKDKVLVKATEPEICSTCHAEQRAQSFKRSRHPIKEGLVVCSDCHNPHGAFGRKLLKQETVNETCFQCHAEKRGPFLWEHAPVTDNCTNCHTPHGSSQPRLLTVRAAWLCQQCHAEAQHPSTLYSGEFFDTTSTALSRLVGKSCLNCHSQIHGSNHPSGARLTR